MKSRFKKKKGWVGGGGDFIIIIKLDVCNVCIVSFYEARFQSVSVSAHLSTTSMKQYQGSLFRITLVFI